MTNSSDLQIAYRIAIRDSGGEVEWATMSPSERTRAIYAAMRQLDLALDADEPAAEGKAN
jgi:hypothetical protein